MRGAQPLKPPLVGGFFMVDNADVPSKQWVLVRLPVQGGRRTLVPYGRCDVAAEHSDVNPIFPIRLLRFSILKIHLYL